MRSIIILVVSLAILLVLGFLLSSKKAESIPPVPQDQVVATITNEPVSPIINQPKPMDTKKVVDGVTFTRFTANDVGTTVDSEDVCGKRQSSCECRFGENKELPFGGYPGIGTFFA